MDRTDALFSLAWIEVSLVLCKLLWMYDLQLLNNDVDWLRDSRMATLWQKPELRVRVKRREVTPDCWKSAKCQHS